MGNWFGDLGIAYKYTVVFMSLLGLTIIAGLLKVLYNRHRLSKFAKAQEDVEAGKEDVVELNQREKDEGDLFGIRAIEAGFTAGIPQSRPTSRAGSFSGTPSMSTNTLVGSFNSPKFVPHSASTSVTSLGLNTEGNRDSETLGNKRKSPPAIKLRPSEAELNGRINHNAGVNMALAVPSSPVLARAPSSPTFSYTASSNGDDSPHSLSPRSPYFKPDHYAPVPPQIPMPDGLQVSVHTPEYTRDSQAASFTDASSSHSAPPSPRHVPEARLPTFPARALRDEPRPSFPNSSPESGESNIQDESTPPLVLLLPHTYQPPPNRGQNNSSNVYSDKTVRSHPTHPKQHERSRSNSSGSTYSYNYSFPDYSSRNSTAPNPAKEQSQQSLHAPSTLLAPSSAAGDAQQYGDARLSEFYDAYYRYSQLPVVQRTDMKRAKEGSVTQETIQEVPSPLPSPDPNANTTNTYGMAV